MTDSKNVQPAPKRMKAKSIACWLIAAIVISTISLISSSYSKSTAVMHYLTKEIGTKAQMRGAMLNINHYDMILGSDSLPKNIEQQAILGLLQNIAIIRTSELHFIKSRFNPTLNLILVNHYPQLIAKYNLQDISNIELKSNMASTIYQNFIKPAHPNLPDEYTYEGIGKKVESYEIPKLDTELPKANFNYLDRIIHRMHGLDFDDLDSN